MLDGEKVPHRRAQRDGEFPTSGCAGECADAIQDTERLVVPTVALYEVFRRIRSQLDSESALRGISQMRRGQVVELDADLAVAAADLGIDLELPLADSIILATARRFEATLWTQDADFDGMPDVEYRPHRG